MSLQIIETTLDAVDPAFHSLYTEKDGQFVLTGIDGMKTDADVARINTALVKERNDHKAVKDKIALLGGKDINEVLTQLDRIPELELAASGKIDDTAINAIVETRLAAKVTPLQRQLDAANATTLALQGEVGAFKLEKETNTIRGALRSAAVKAGVRPDAIEDAVLLGERYFEISEGSVIAKENSGVTQGIDPNMWLADQQTSRAYLWGESVGGGSTGSTAFKGVNNPWSASNWNMTEQASLYQQNPAKADQMAKAAGTTIGGVRPSK